MIALSSRVERMNNHPATPQDLASIMRKRAVTVAPLGDLTAMNRYADWLDEMTDASMSHPETKPSSPPQGCPTKAAGMLSG